MTSFASSLTPIASVADYRPAFLQAVGRRSGRADFLPSSPAPYPLGNTPRYLAERFERFHFTKNVIRWLNRTSCCGLAALVKRRPVRLTPSAGLHPFDLHIRTRFIDLRCRCFPVRSHVQEGNSEDGQGVGKARQGIGNE